MLSVHLKLCVGSFEQPVRLSVGLPLASKPRWCRASFDMFGMKSIDGFPEVADCFMYGRSLMIAPPLLEGSAAAMVWAA